MTNDIQKTPENKLSDGKTPRQNREIAGARYVPPQIISHSASQLEKQNLRVNACTSYFP